MDKEILEILKLLQKDNQEIKSEVMAMQGSIKSLDESQKEIKSEVKAINKKLDGVVEQTANLLEFRSDMSEQMKTVNGNVEAIRKDLLQVEIVTSNNWNEITKLKAVR